jgi:hypothetical protein
MDCGMKSSLEQFKHSIDEILDNSQDIPKKPLYHYTSFKGLNNILKSKCLWLTDHQYLNDPSEIIHGKNIILKLISNKLNSHKFCCNHFINLFNKIIDNHYKTYLTSFCQDPDYLPAWRYYGHNGAGFSIGFKVHFFIPEPKNKDNAQGTIVYKVNYGSDIISIDDMFNIADILFPKWYESNKIKEINKIILPIITASIILISGYKNYDYHDEKEWRICLTKIFNDETWFPSFPYENFFIDNISNEKYTPFLKSYPSSIPRLSILDFEYQDIESIYVGPRLDYQTAKLAIEKYLGSLGIEIGKIKIMESTKQYK